MRYKGFLKISKEDMNYYNDLLQLDLDINSEYYNIEDISRLSARTDDYIDIGIVEFRNGNFVVIALTSGNSNYYDSICLYDKEGRELLCRDCNFEISSFSLSYKNDIYDIVIETF